MSEEEAPQRSRLGRLAAAAPGATLPGILAGIQLAGLLFFLNPDLPFSALPFLRAAGFYSALLGTASLLLQLPFVWRRPERIWRILPWALSLVFALAATIDWVHASYFAYYLPAGINRRLIKAAIWLSLTALISFYTALIHSRHRRAYGVRSRIGLGLLSILSIYVVLERREAFRPPLAPAPRPSSAESPTRPRLAVVGVECASLDAILPLAEQGRLPFFETMLQQGVHGHLESLQPTRPGPLWTTLATGKYPYKHGLVDDRAYETPFLPPSIRLQLVPVGLRFHHWGARPAPVDSRNVQALPLWQILSRLQIPTVVLGWPTPTTPSSSRPPGGRAQPAIAPPEVPAATLNGFGPAAPAELRQILAEDLKRYEWARAHLRSASATGENDVLFVALPGLCPISQRFFGGYSAVQFDGAQERRFQEAAQVVTAYYAQLDLLLQGIWSHLEPPRQLAVVSAFGVRPSRGPWPWSVLSRQRSLEGSWRRGTEGLLLLLGDGLESGTFLNRAALADLTPTLLYGLGFPVARDFDGRVLAEAYDSDFLARHPLSFVPSYETMRPP